MRIIMMVAVCVGASTSLMAQTGDYPDYRSKKELFSRIQEKDIRAEVATFTMGGIEESVGKEPLATIPVSAFSSHSITFQDDRTTLTITSIPFEAAKHRLTYYDPEKTYLVKIDNKPYFGDYGKVPKSVVGSVQLIVGRDTVNVPEAALNDLANPQLSFMEGGKNKTQNKVYRSADGKRIYVYMLKPEAGGSYEVTWVFQDGKYLRRVVDFGFLR